MRAAASDEGSRRAAHRAPRTASPLRLLPPGRPDHHVAPAQWPSRHQERRETKRRKTPNEPVDHGTTKSQNRNDRVDFFWSGDLAICDLAIS